MKKSIALVVLLDLSFLLLLALSGGFSGVLGEAFYILAYALPIAVGAVAVYRSGRGAAMPRLRLERTKLLPAIMTMPPIMLAIIGISAVTSLILTSLGITDISDVSGNLATVLLRHALLPALLEETLFRYLPIKLLSPYSRRVALIVSSVSFALIHVNLFQIPYALFAGIALGFLTLSSGSVLPAFLLHLLNNAVSVIWMRNPDFWWIIISALAALTLISAVYIVMRKKAYAAELREAFSGEKIGFSAELFIMAVLCILLSVINLR